MNKKEATKFAKELKSNRIKFTKLLNPRICYTSDWDMFDIVWGDKKIESTIEADLGGNAIRFDLTKDNIIVGIEIENFSEVLEKFDCDKNKILKKEKNGTRKIKG